MEFESLKMFEFNCVLGHAIVYYLADDECLDKRNVLTKSEVETLLQQEMVRMPQVSQNRKDINVEDSFDSGYNPFEEQSKEYY